jgi:hypothetical protein
MSNRNEEAKTKRQTIVLGSSGFIGNALCGIIPNVQSMNRMQINEMLSNKKEIMMIDDLDIINCISSKANLNYQSHYESNYKVPLMILNKLANSKFRWIQLDSYYREFRVKYDEDLDDYAMLKRKFREELVRRGDNFVNLVLPHITDFNESHERFMARFVRKHLRNEVVTLYSMVQKIPILPLPEFLNDFITLLQNVDFEQHGDFDASSKKSNEFYISAKFVVSPLEIAEVLEELTNRNVRILISNPSNRKVFPIIDWPIKSKGDENVKLHLIDYISKYINAIEREEYNETK